MGKSADNAMGLLPREPLLPALLLAAAAVAVLTSYSVLTQAAFSLPKLSYGAFAALAAAAAAFLYALAGRRSLLSAGPDAAVAAMLGAALASAWFSTDRPLSLFGHYQFYGYGLCAAAVYVLLYASAAQFRSAREMQTVSWAIELSAAAAAAVAVLQALGIDPFYGVTTVSAFGGRSVSLYGNPVYAGTVFVLAWPLLLREAEGKSLRVVFIGAALLLLAGLYCVKSRGAWLSAAAATGVYYFCTGRFRAWGRKRGLALAAVCCVLALLALTIRGKRQSDEARLELWKSSISVFASRPLLGVGPAAFENSFRRLRSEGFIRALGPTAGQANAHNDFLQVLSTMGLAGFAAYLWLLVAGFRAVQEGLRGPHAADAAAYGAALAGLFIQAKFNPTPFASTAAAALLLGLCAAAARRADARPAGKARMWGAAAALCAAAFASAIIGRMHLADRAALRARVYKAVGQKDGALRNYRVAMELHPVETRYRMDYVRFLVEEARSAPDAAQRVKILKDALGAARESARLRPFHVDSYQMLGLVYLQLGADAAAADALDKALALDPHFPNLLKMRGAAAEGLGDSVAVESMKERLRFLETLARP